MHAGPLPHDGCFVADPSLLPVTAVRDGLAIKVGIPEGLAHPNADITIAEIGAKHNLPCPTIRKLVDMIHEVENGTRPMTDDNLLELIPA